MAQSQSAESVIWIASYPKSGNTWMQTVVRMAGQSFGFPNMDLDVYKLKSEKLAPAVVSGIQPSITTTRTAVLKTHSIYVPGRRVAVPSFHEN